MPLDYDHPRGSTIGIALAKIPATNPAERIGTVFINPGGPGGSGVGLALTASASSSGTTSAAGSTWSASTRAASARPAPLRCFGSEAELDAYLSEYQVLFPYRAAQERAFFATSVELAGRCFARDATIARHMSTADVVRDLDLLRRAVGDRKLTYLGFSYGSYIGNTYANLFPGNVRALVIDGVLDPRLWSSGWQVKSDRVATQEEFEEFLRLCDAAGDVVRLRRARRRGGPLGAAGPQPASAAGDLAGRLDLHATTS